VYLRAGGDPRKREPPYWRHGLAADATDKRRSVVCGALDGWISGCSPSITAVTTGLWWSTAWFFLLGGKRARVCHLPV
jgi:hypothetical protein